MKQGEKVDAIKELPAAVDLARDGLRSEKQLDVFMAPDHIGEVALCSCTMGHQLSGFSRDKWNPFCIF